MKRYYYSDTIQNFLKTPAIEILGQLANNNEFPTELTQRTAWNYQIDFLKSILFDNDGLVYFEYAIPRMGRRIDVVLIIKNVIFVLEFKVGEKDFPLSGIDQVWDYALDLKNFHETSHNHFVAPILIATSAVCDASTIVLRADKDQLFVPIKTNSEGLSIVITAVLQTAEGEDIDGETWVNGRYSPTPTIIEAATALYGEHTVADISRSDASATNLRETSSTVSKIIAFSKANNEKAICFVTGVPGAGKTLVGLDIATKYLDAVAGSQSVFLSGNGPLVAILTEALARDAIIRGDKKGEKIRKGEARSKVK
ncbi:MAG: DNA/RNA helicase domain-containing protein, partial [Pyrinomonadaceae bacterium]